MLILSVSTSRSCTICASWRTLLPYQITQITQITLLYSRDVDAPARAEHTEELRVNDQVVAHGRAASGQPKWRQEVMRTMVGIRVEAPAARRQARHRESDRSHLCLRCANPTKASTKSGRYCRNRDSMRHSRYVEAGVMVVSPTLAPHTNVAVLEGRVAVLAVEWGTGRAADLRRTIISRYRTT